MTPKGDIYDQHPPMHLCYEQTMYQIKFRAWDRANEEMRDWDSLLFPKSKYFGLQWLLSNLPQDHKHVLMQFTGHHDKNGKEIYSGDIVRSTHDGDQVSRGISEFVIEPMTVNHMCAVTLPGIASGLWGKLFRDGSSLETMEFIVNGITGERYTTMMAHGVWGRLPNLEVIGNVYENKKLLK